MRERVRTIDDAGFLSADHCIDMSSTVLRDKLTVVKAETSCAACRKKLDERIWKAVVGWTMLPVCVILPYRHSTDHLCPDHRLSFRCSCVRANI